MGYIINYSGEFTDTTLPTFPLAFSTFPVGEATGLLPVEGGIHEGEDFTFLGTDTLGWFTENGSAKKKYPMAAATVGLAVVDVGVPNVLVQTSILASSSVGVGLAARVTDSANYVAIRSGVSNALEVLKVVAGTGTVITSIPGVYVMGRSWGLKVVGSTITVYKDGVVLWTGTDPNLPTGSGHGFYAREVTYSAPAWSDLTITRA